MINDTIIPKNKIIKAIEAIGTIIILVKIDNTEILLKTIAIIGIIPIVAENEIDNESANCLNKNFSKNLESTGLNNIIPRTAINESLNPTE